MAPNPAGPAALSDAAARQLANATKTTAQLSIITPRWLVHLLQWVPVEAGIYRLNKVVDVESIDVACPPRDESELPQTFVPYDESPREYFLNSVTTVLDVHTRVSDLYSSPYDQIKEQLRLTVETIKERQEGELINNAITASWPTSSPSRPSRPWPDRRRPTTSTSCSPRSGRSLPSSSPTHWPSLHSGASAPAGVCRRPRSASSDPSS